MVAMVVILRTVVMVVILLMVVVMAATVLMVEVMVILRTVMDMVVIRNISTIMIRKIQMTSDDQIWETSAVAMGYGYRLSWPDDYFTVYHELSMEHYRLQNMGSYFYFLADENGQVNGTFNNFSFKTVFGRNSVDNPLYSRHGSQLTLSLKLTPPFSLV